MAGHNNKKPLPGDLEPSRVWVLRVNILTWTVFSSGGQLVCKQVITQKTVSPPFTKEGAHTIEWLNDRLLEFVIHSTEEAGRASSWIELTAATFYRLGVGGPDPECSPSPFLNNNED